MPSTPLPDLIARIERLAHAGKIVRLRPETAFTVLAALRAYAVIPTRNEIAKAICGSKPCPGPCDRCVMYANAVDKLLRGDPPTDPGAASAPAPRAPRLRVVGD